MGALFHNAGTDASAWAMVTGSVSLRGEIVRPCDASHFTVGLAGVLCTLTTTAARSAAPSATAAAATTTERFTVLLPH